MLANFCTIYGIYKYRILSTILTFRIYLENTLSITTRSVQ